MPVWLNEHEVRAALSMPELIAAMRTALADFSSGKVHQPVRTVIEVERNQSFLGVMPAYARTTPALGAKLVTVFGRNPSIGLHSHDATILLLDPQTGALLSVMDGRFITEARTAAVSAVAADLLASAETPVLAILGSGVQARSHLQALQLVRQFREIRCWSPTRSNLERFVQESRSAVIPHSTAESAVRGADVIALVTASTEPVLRAEWVQDGACVLSVGACRPNQREMDPALVARSRLFVDSRAAALQESGDIVLGIAEGRFTAAHIAAEIGEVLDGTSSGRRSRSEIAIFKSLGLAVEDVAAAHLAYTRAQSSGRGLQLT
jgi:ornithine cyclodeaminase/alanine dehydrogenase-like protein (mu-crystallin family)